jgi:hypothetical protein
MCALTMCFTTLSKSGFHLVVLPTWLSSWKWETSWIISDTRYWYFDGRCVAGALNSKAIRTTTRLVLSKAGGRTVSSIHATSSYDVLLNQSFPSPPKKTDANPLPKNSSARGERRKTLRECSSGIGLIFDGRLLTAKRFLRLLLYIYI